MFSKQNQIKYVCYGITSVMVNLNKNVSQKKWKDFKNKLISIKSQTKFEKENEN